MTGTGTLNVEAILDTIIDAVITIDERGVIQSVNRAVERIFGYRPQELIGQNVSMLMPNPAAREHDEHLHNYMRTHQSAIMNSGREVLAKKKDGTVFPVYLGLSEGLRDGDRQLFTGVIRDITETKRAENEIKRQSEFTAAVLNTVQSLVIVMDRQGRIVSFNRACELLTGYSFAEVSGKPFWDVFLTDEEREPVMKHFSLLTKTAAHHPSHFENYWLTRSGERRLISWSNTALLGAEGRVDHVIGTGIDITERRQLERMVVELSKEEQRRLGQELHDGIAQHLTTTALTAKVLEQKLMKRSPKAARALKRVVRMVNEAVAQARTLAQGLYMPDIQSQGLAHSLKKLAHDPERTAGVRCSVRVDAPVRLAGGAAATHLYRIAREAVSNAVKHGQARRISIELKRKSVRERALVIRSDGKRFSKPVKKNGMGLPLMRSRAALLNATLDIGPGPRGGTVVRCVFPVLL